MDERIKTNNKTVMTKLDKFLHKNVNTCYICKDKFSAENESKTSCPSTTKYRKAGHL